MNCPKCNCGLIRTTMSRHYRDDAVIRRRKCSGCGHAWYTMETKIPTEAVTHARTYEGMSTFKLRKDFEGLAYR